MILYFPIAASTAGSIQCLLDELQEAQAADGFDPQIVDKLPWLGAVINESLRITPGASFVPRRLDQDVEIAGVHVPAGTCIATNVIGAHSRQETWGDPEVFRPERFLEQSPTAWTFLPFGGGIRRCLGRLLRLQRCAWSLLICLAIGVSH